MDEKQNTEDRIQNTDYRVQNTENGASQAPIHDGDKSGSDGADSTDSVNADGSGSDIVNADYIDPDFENDPSKNPSFNPAFNYTPPKLPNYNPPPAQPSPPPDAAYPPPGYYQQGIPHNPGMHERGYNGQGQAPGLQPPPGQYGRMPSPYDYEAFMRAKNSRRFPIGAVFACTVIIILIAVIIALVSYRANTPQIPSDVSPNTPQRDIALYKPSEGAVDITVEQVDRPALADEYYVNKEAGLLTAEGVGSYVMPSVALINVYADNYFMPIAYGSGVVMSANGYIITNAHVVMDGLSYSVTLSDGVVYEAALVGMSVQNDVAVLKISAEGLTPATFGKTEDVRLGEEVVIVASSGSTFDNFCTFGHVSNTDRVLSSETSTDLKCFQTDAAVNAGTSGGPVVNMYGQCIGIVVGKYIDLTNGMYENMGFVIQIDTVLETAESLIENGYVEGEVILGILYMSFDNISAEAYGLPSGLLVSDVTADGGAYAAGILPNDIITKINGSPVLSAESIAKVLEGKRAGDTVVVEVARKKITGEVQTLEIPVVLKQRIDLPGNDTYTPEPEVTE